MICVCGVFFFLFFNISVCRLLFLLIKRYQRLFTPNISRTLHATPEMPFWLRDPWFLGHTRVQIPNGISISSAVLAQLMVMTSRHKDIEAHRCIDIRTHRHTDIHARRTECMRSGLIVTLKLWVDNHFWVSRWVIRGSKNVTRASAASRINNALRRLQCGAPSQQVLSWCCRIFPAEFHLPQVVCNQFPCLPWSPRYSAKSLHSSACLCLPLSLAAYVSHNITWHRPIRLLRTAKPQLYTRINKAQVWNI